MQDRNFEIVAVAEDTAGEAAAGRFYDAAKATYTTLIDTDHTVSSLYSMVNVPTGVLIDEEGVIVRQDEGAYSRSFEIGTMTIGTDEYTPAIRDWVEKGNDSIYAQDPDAIAAKLARRSPNEALADANFRLGVYFHHASDDQLANQYWEAAQKLNPDSWNYHRQDWSFTPDQAMRNWFAKFQALGDKPYYAPMDLPEDGEK